MRRWMSIILSVMLAVMCMVTMTVPAFAAENPGVSIPVKITLSGTKPNPAENYTIKLEADDTSYPMPEGAKNGVYTMTITGAATKNLPTITYGQVGIYTYKISQVAGSNKKCTYDKSVYTLTVYITNAEDGGGLEATAAVRLLKDGEEAADKTDVVFKNVYPTVKPVTPKTGDDSPPLLYAGMVAVGLGVIVALFVTRKPKQSEE